ncbi:MAG: hypothetical protein U5M23_09380 [Marinagarivorans sp.]|nr:hypothetical protein [Marinagarivorans sp.]
MIMQKLAIPSLLIAMPMLLAPLAFADIYKCSFSDGSSRFEQQCPKNTLRSEKLELKDASNIGFGQKDSQHPSIGDLLLPNGDFENTLASWQVITGEPNTLEKEGIAGSYALQLQGKDASVAPIRLRQCLPTQDIGEISVSAFVKQESIDAPQESELRVVWFTNKTCSDSGQHAAMFKPTAAPSWQKLEHKKLVPALGAQALMVEIAFEGSNKHQVLWDDIDITLTAASRAAATTAIDPKYTLAIGQNHFQNADFNNNTNGWTSGWPVEWGAYAGQGITAGVRVLASSDFGKRIKGDALSQCINFGNNQHFTLSADVKHDPISSQKGRASLMVYWLELPDCQGRQQVGPEVTSRQVEGWQTLSNNISAPANAQSVMVKAYQVVDGTGLYGAFWDNFSFTASSDLSPTTTDTPTP